MEQKSMNQELLRVSARLYALCAVMDFIARAANENIYGNMMFHLADSLNRISDDFSETLDEIDAFRKAD